MAEKSHISWTDSTWNPILGCDKVSAGCANCYAVDVAHRHASNPNAKIAAANAGLVQIQPNGKRNWTGLVRCLPDRLTLPLTWKEPRRIFVNSLSDLFHDDVPRDFIEDVFRTMFSAPQHIYQILTKRPERMRQTMPILMNRMFGPHWTMPHFIWLGVSVEDQKTAEARIPLLLRTPAGRHWLSCEPLLGPVDLSEWISPPGQFCCPRCRYHLTKRILYAQTGAVGIDDSQEREVCPNDGADLIPASFVDWIVCGGESGNGARPMHPDWARSLQRQCEVACVPFHFKQWGTWLPFEPTAQEPYWRDQTGEEHDSHGLEILDPDTNETNPAWFDDLFYGYEDGHPSDACAFKRVGKKAAGRLLDGKLYDEYPEARP